MNTDTVEWPLGLGGNSQVYYSPEVPVMLTACGKLRIGPKVRGLLDRAQPEEIERICSFVYYWHLLEWEDMREPEETP